jgi:CubicO group peptidase (beta-lactamase class C family)
MPIVLAVLLVLAGSCRVVVAQVETPVPGLPATPIATPQTAAQQNLAGVAPLPLTGERRATFETYIADALNRFGVPGASVAVVQAGEVVYSQGFGVKAVGGTDPVTADTLMMIGSVNKSMTATMAATVVDDGWLSWDTPLVELLPGFAVADPQLTPRLTVADAFCTCTGLPRRDLELLFHFDDLPPDRLIAQVAELPLTAPFGERYQYSNQMFALGGYAAAAAAGAAPNDLYGGYQLVMHERLLNPIGMHRSTFALDEVLASGDYAHPHATDLDGNLQRVSLPVDARFPIPVAPVGALWSSARDVARYVQTELADGVAPDGTRVVSVENLARTRAPRVAIPPEPGIPTLFSRSGNYYAMGWVVDTYQGQPVLCHTGGTLGFVSEVAFLPEADLGVVILTNGGQGAGPFNFAVQFRLLELLFDQPAEFDAMLEQALEAQMAQFADFRAQLGTVDRAAVAEYLGRYEHAALGEVELVLWDDTLVFDVGEVRWELRPLVDGAGEVVGYVFTDPPLAGATPVTLRRSEDGQPEVMVTVGGDVEETYVFTYLGEGLPATPTP